MAGPLRCEQAGGWYPITSRGNERRAIFRDDRDRLHWCEMVARARYREFVGQAVRQGLEKTPWESLKEGLVLGSQRFLARIQGADAAEEREKGVNNRDCWRPTWEQTVRVVEESCGQKWEQFRDRHRDTGRDLALSLARSRGHLTLRKRAEVAGMRSEAAVNVAIKRYQRIVETNAVEARRAKGCIAQLNKIGEMLNV